MKLSEWSLADRLALDDKAITFEVFRNNEWTPRYGTVSRMKANTFFVGAYCYSVAEVRNVREVE
jgi:hypothetical protein